MLGEKEAELRNSVKELQKSAEELHKSAAQRSRLNETISSLHRDVNRFRKRCDRADSIRSRAIEKAVDNTRKHFRLTNTRRVKRPDGRIEDWVRDLVVELVALDGVPTAKVPSVIERVRSSIVPTATGDDDDDGDGQDADCNRRPSGIALFGKC